jgi:L-rhamnose mutarotase
MSLKRVASVVGLDPDKEMAYRELHRKVWPEVLEVLVSAGVTNYSIFLRDSLLFSYFEFVGDDYESAMAGIASDKTTKEWWKLTEPCQRPLPSTGDGEWWANADEVFHLD